jgi:hypothetical protein
MILTPLDIDLIRVLAYLNATKDEVVETIIMCDTDKDRLIMLKYLIELMKNKEKIDHKKLVDKLNQLHQ